MSYTERNFKTKKAVKDAVAAWNAHASAKAEVSGPMTVGAMLLSRVPVPSPVYAYNPGLGGDLSNFTGRVYLEGPHFPEPHRWYAQAEMVNGVVVKVK